MHGSQACPIDSDQWLRHDERLGALPEGIMATVLIEISDDEAQQLADVASNRGLTPAELVRRWVQERLVHERERAAGGGKPMSPRARREQEPGARPPH